MSLGISPGQLSNHEVEREGRREAAAPWLHTWLGSRHRAVHGSRCSCLAAGCTEPLHITAGWSNPLCIAAEQSPHALPWRSPKLPSIMQAAPQF